MVRVTHFHIQSIINEAAFTAETVEFTSGAVHTINGSMKVLSNTKIRGNLATLKAVASYNFEVFPLSIWANTEGTVAESSVCPNNRTHGRRTVDKHQNHRPASGKERRQSAPGRVWDVGRN